MTYGTGRGGFHLAAQISTWEKYVRVELYIVGEKAEDRLDLLEQKKDEIEQEMEYPLEWGDQSANGRDRRISFYLRDVDLENESDWPRQHEWLTKHLNDMHRAFAQQVRDL